MKMTTLVDLSQEELVEKEKALRKELFNLRFQGAMGHIENPNRFKEVRRGIARVMTVIRMQKDQKDKRSVVEGESETP